MLTNIIRKECECEPIWVYKLQDMSPFHSFIFMGFIFNHIIPEVDQ